MTDSIEQDVLLHWIVPTPVNDAAIHRWWTFYATTEDGIICRSELWETQPENCYNKTQLLLSHSSEIPCHMSHRHNHLEGILANVSLRCNTSQDCGSNDEWWIRWFQGSSHIPFSDQDNQSVKTIIQEIYKLNEDKETFGTGRDELQGGMSRLLIHKLQNLSHSYVMGCTRNRRVDLIECRMLKFGPAFSNVFTVRRFQVRIGLARRDPCKPIDRQSHGNKSHTGN